jgi:DNA-binding protein H-NS
MTTLAQIKAQIEELQKQADELINQQKVTVIAELKTKIKEYKITASELGYSGKTAKTGTPAVKAEPKYKNESGETWSGSRGRKPQWVNDIVNSGGDIEKYLITKAEEV